MDPQDSFPQRVWQIVASIPEGFVTTYGDVARLAGSPRAARQVGGVALKGDEEDARRLRHYVDNVVRERARSDARWKDFLTAAGDLWR